MRTFLRVSRQLARMVPDEGWRVSWYDALSCHYFLIMTDCARECLTLSVECAVSIDVDYQRGGRKWRTGGARADAFVTERGRISAKGGATVLKE